MRKLVHFTSSYININVYCLLQTNIVPVIAKADTFTPEECVRFKKVVSKLVNLLLLL